MTASNSTNNVLVKYVRDYNNDPVATIVATARGKVGVSICSPKDKFDKHVGKRIAITRANHKDESKREPIIPNREIGTIAIDNVYGEDMRYLVTAHIADIIADECMYMALRSCKYFKESVTA